MPSWRVEPAALSPLPRSLAWSLAGVPKTPPLVMDSSWLAPVFGSSSSSEPRLARAPREYWLTPGAVPAPSPLPGGGAPFGAPPAAPEVEDEVGRAFELERGRSVVRHELFQEAMGDMS